MFKVYLFIVALVCAFKSIQAAGVTCIQCNSTANVECATNPTAITETCQTADETIPCYSYIEGTTTIRGCEAKTPCEEANCKDCKDEKCNADIIPKDRATCLQCKGKETCATPDSTVKAQPCPKFVAADECFTYIADDGTAYRGCVSDDLTECKDHEKLCVKCKGDGCNNLAATQKPKCLECFSSEGNNTSCIRLESPGENCNITVSETCEDSILLGRDQKCFVQFDGKNVRRGCGSKDLPTAGIVETCVGEKCNNFCALKPSCFVCDSTAPLSKCKSKDLDTFLKPCTETAVLCSVCEKPDSDQLVRACDNEAPAEMICKSCYGDKCNNLEKLPKRCFTCDSKTNPKCTRNEDITSEFCSDDSQQCYVKLDSDGTTTRGCIKKDDCKEGCQVCDTHECNTKVLATGFISCFTCNDAESCAESQRNPNITATQCSTPGDQCYMLSTDGKTMQRGCFSTADTPAECKNNDPKCVTCRTSGCNYSPLTGTEQKCIQCKDDNSCPWRHLPSNAAVCPGNVTYMVQELCFTLPLSNGVTERGCLSQQIDCTLQNRDCRVCYDDACNTQATKTFSCIRCRSDVDPDCIKNDKFESLPCATDPLSSRKGCYEEVYNGVVIRGCVSDLDDFALGDCKQSNLCNICSEEGCNKNAMDNSSPAVISSVFVLLSSFVVIFILSV